MNKKLLMIVAGVMVLVAGGGYFAVQKLTAPPPPPPAKPKPAVTATPKAPAATPPATAPASGPTPSETVNAIAKAPVNAVNKAQDAVAKRGASGQVSGVDGVTGGEVANKAATPATKAAAPRATTELAPGISATSDVDAAPAASQPFRSFVANAKISGVIGGNPPKAFINGRLVRGGEMADEGLGITFDSIDGTKRLMVFKDKAGATVTRRF